MNPNGFTGRLSIFEKGVMAFFYYYYCFVEPLRFRDKRSKIRGQCLKAAGEMEPMGSVRGDSISQDKAQSYCLTKK